jgi:tetratricopeptide (TPR) repeat protein
MTTALFAVVLLAAAQAEGQFKKWEVKGLLGVLPPVALDKSPIAVQIRDRLSSLHLNEARELSAVLMRQEPRDYEGYFWAGFVDLQQGNFYTAVRHLRQAEKLRPPGNAVQKVIGLAYLELSQQQLFQLKMNEAIALDPADFSPHYCLGRYVQSQKRDHEEAAKQYRLVLERKPDHYEALYYLGLASEAAGNMLQAGNLYERAIAASESSGQTFSLPYQGLSRVNRTDHPETALKFASRAVSLEPKSAESQLELGRVYAALGRFSEAEAALKASIALDPTESSPYYHLFSAYRHLGQTKASDEALAGFERATGCYGRND